MEPVHPGLSLRLGIGVYIFRFISDFNPRVYYVYKKKKNLLLFSVEMKPKDRRKTENGRNEMSSLQHKYHLSNKVKNTRSLVDHARFLRYAPCILVQGPFLG